MLKQTCKGQNSQLYLGKIYIQLVYFFFYCSTIIHSPIVRKSTQNCYVKLMTIYKIFIMLIMIGKHMKATDEANKILSPNTNKRDQLLY